MLKEPQNEALLRLLHDAREPVTVQSQRPLGLANLKEPQQDKGRLSQLTNLREPQQPSLPVGSQRAPMQSLLRANSIIALQPGSVASTALSGGPHPTCPIALLFSGGARDVHMTAPSILRNLVSPLGASRVCIFIRALLDPDAHKIAALLNATGVHVVAIHLGPVMIPPDERARAAHVLQAQGHRVLEESQQLEDVQDLVEAFERARGTEFRLVVRARLDSFWTAPIHVAKISRAMEDGVYVVPKGKAFRGLNDRFGMCNSRTARAIHRRAAFLRAGAGSHFRLHGLNSEMYLNWTMRRHCISPLPMPGFPFCLLVKRKCKCCLTDTRCARAGSKCRPCTYSERRASKSSPIRPEWPKEAIDLYDASFSEYASQRQRVAALRGAPSVCLRVWKELTSRHRIAWSNAFGAACNLANALGCRFNSDEGRWVGRGCLVDSTVALRTVATRDSEQDQALLRPIPTCNRGVSTIAAGLKATLTRPGVPMSSTLLPTFSSWRRRFGKHVGHQNKAARRAKSAAHSSADYASANASTCTNVSTRGASPVQQMCADPGPGIPWWLDSQPVRHKITVLTMVKQASAIVQDWIAYHLMAGVDHFYVVVNDCRIAADEYRKCGALLPYVQAGVVSLEDTLFRCQQVSRAKVLGAAVAEIARKSGRNDWLLGIDPDEYVVLPSHQRLGAFIESLSPDALDSISLPWRVFGTSFRKEPAPRGGMIGNYRLRVWLDAPFAVAMQLVEEQRKKDQIHPFLAKELVRAEALTNQSRCKETNAAAHTYRCERTQSWFPQLRGTLLEQSGFRAREARAWINHYTYLSESEWERKKLRGRPRFGVGYAPRSGDVAGLLSVELDVGALEYIRGLARSAEEWSDQPIRVRRCAVALASSDDHFDAGLPVQKAAAVAAAAVRAHQATAPAQFANLSMLRRADANATREAIVMAMEKVYQKIAHSQAGASDAAMESISPEDLQLISACAWHEVACSSHRRVEAMSRGSGFKGAARKRGGGNLRWALAGF